MRILSKGNAMAKRPSRTVSASEGEAVMDLTENEKAATFIGWKDRERCLAPKKPVDDREFGDVWCPSCNEVYGCGDHDVKCPDMSDLRNYMKALEGNGIKWAHQLDGPWYVSKSNGSCGDGATVGKALAALYDAEHAKEKP